MRIEKDQQLVTLLSMVFGLVFFITIASAADRETDSPPEKITIAYSSVSGHMEMATQSTVRRTAGNHLTSADGWRRVPVGGDY